MATTIVVPELGESIVEATVVRWLKKEGEAVAAGDPLVELETEKVNVEVGAEAAGVLATIGRKAGEDVKVGDVLGVIEEGAAPAAAPPPAREEPKEASRPAAVETEAPAAERKPPAAPPEAPQPERKPAAPAPSDDAAKPATPSEAAPAPVAPPPAGDRREERVPMSRRRRTIARRLVEAQQTAAMLTTFNEVNMAAVMDLRARHKESFQKRNDVKLGFMSFFVKAVVGGLKAHPHLNAEIQDEVMVVKHYYDIGIAMDAPGGLVVPVLRNAERMSFADIERGIIGYAEAARAGSLSLEALRGGSFTITNGGVFGSMLSTPILNPPQVGILGMHRIQERPVVENGEIVVRPMMYLALSYDHRIVDGRDAVTFLVRVKELIENPERLLLES